MLHQQAGTVIPIQQQAPKAMGGTTGLHQLDNIGVETDGSHGQDNAKTC